MDVDYNFIIKTVANEVFKTNKDIIIEQWLQRVAEDHKDLDTEFYILKDAFERLVNDFITYLSVEDYSSYYKSNEQIACSIAYNDISFDKFIDIFHLFEDSYLPIIEKLSNKDFRKYVTCVDKLHHKTIAIITKKYFDIRDDIIFALTNLIELRDCETAEHLERTRRYSIMLAKELGQDDDFIDSLYKASMLHDIGKVAVRDGILLKPGKLTDEEFDEIRKHTVIGAKAIDRIINNQKIDRGYLLMARDISLYHHEKFDGSGYPYGMKADEIPLPARILAVVDAYDTIVSSRSYKTALPHDEAVRRIIVDSGKHFDPAVVEAFLRIQVKFKEISL